MLESDAPNAIGNLMVNLTGNVAVVRSGIHFLPAADVRNVVRYGKIPNVPIQEVAAGPGVHIWIGMMVWRM